jgi:rhamnosyltransferase
VTAPLRYFGTQLRECKVGIKTKCYKLFKRLKKIIIGFYRRFELGSSFNGEVLSISGKLSKANSTVCFFSHFDKDGLVDDYVVFYLTGLKKVGVDIAFISTSTSLSEDELDKVRQLCDVVIHKENIGYDFGAWKTGFDVLAGDLNFYDELILCNDSVYAPLYDIKPMFELMRNKKSDFWSITDSLERGLHLQSYFLVFNKNVFSSSVFQHIWSKYKIYKHKENIINKYEVKLMRRLLKKGFEPDTYCSYTCMSDKSPRNITHHDWNILISDFKCPIIKIELLRDNPAEVDISDWEFILSNSTEYDVSLIKNHLERINRLD